MKTLHTNYKLAPGDVRLTVLVGNGHRGNTLVAVGSDVLVNQPDIRNVRIGSADDLRGKTLSVITTVSQVNTATADAIVTYQARGGAENRDFQLDDDFADGEVQLQFVATFDFTE
ncbi:MAG TPA: hypothetical protein VJN39_09890 [Gemmatimonadales bacterium]|nr:hypothetical protein [Gemmatimonadales bacterium]